MIIPTITTPQVTHTWASMRSPEAGAANAPALGDSAITEKVRYLIFFFKARRATIDTERGVLADQSIPSIDDRHASDR
jgi:hypothetical protein